MTYQIKKYQSFEKIKNRWGGFVKLYSGIYTHHCIHNAAKKNQSKRVELFKYFLSETAFSTREIKVKNKNFTLHKHYALINASAIKKKLDINRGIIVAFLNDLERDDTISITSIKGIGYLIKFNNFEKFQKKDAQIKVDTTIYRTFLDYDVINLMHKMNLKQSQNKLSYNKEELKELKELKETDNKLQLSNERILDLEKKLMDQKNLNNYILCKFLPKGPESEPSSEPLPESSPYNSFDEGNLNTDKTNTDKTNYDTIDNLHNDTSEDSIEELINSDDSDKSQRGVIEFTD